MPLLMIVKTDNHICDYKRGRFWHTYEYLENSLVEASKYVTIDARAHKRELDRLAEMVPEEHHEILRLPFILLREMPIREYIYQIAGTRLENIYLKRLLKISNTRIKNDNLKDNRGLNEISMLSRRRFKTIYKILPESSIIWLNTQYHQP